MPLGILIPDADTVESIRYRFDASGKAGLGLDEVNLRAMAEQARRASLADAVRVSAALFPKLHAVLEEARTRVASWLEVEAFVWSDPKPQAWCISPPGSGSALLGITSGVVELLEPEELAFVIGHEIGHALFGHVGHALESQRQDDVPMLSLRAISRAAEISADRIGRMSAPSTEAATGAMIKIASGLGAPHLRLDVTAFLEQLDDLGERGGGSMRTHPLFTLRCRALLWFEQSEPFNRLGGLSCHGRRAMEEIDDHIERELSATLGFRQASANQEAMRSGLLWGALSLFALDGKLERSEQLLLRRFCGERPAGKAIEFLRDHGPEAVQQRLSRALVRASTLPAKDGDALLRDLEVLASSAGGRKEDLLSFLLRVREALGLERPVGIGGSV